MTTFDNREQGYERKYALDEEQRFKAVARRNKLLGLWAAEKLGKTGEHADAYAKDVVLADFEEAGDEDLVRKLSHDFSEAGQNVEAAEIRQRLDFFMAVAAEQVKQTG